MINEENTAEVRRGPGRPPKDADIKKGSSTWKPANVLDVFSKELGYRYRVVEKSPRNVARKKQEGWETVSAIESPNTGNNAGNYLDKGKALTSVVEGYDYLIMRIPEEIAKQRDNYMNNETSRRTESLRKQTGKDLSKEGAPIHGSITMEKKGVRNIIND